VVPFNQVNDVHSGHVVVSFNQVNDVHSGHVVVSFNQVQCPTGAHRHNQALPAVHQEVAQHDTQA